MQSTNLKEIKSALWDQAFMGRTWVSCPMGRVVGNPPKEGAASCDDLGVGTLVPGGAGAHRCCAD